MTLLTIYIVSIIVTILLGRTCNVRMKGTNYDDFPAYLCFIPVVNIICSGIIIYLLLGLHKQHTKVQKWFKGEE